MTYEQLDTIADAYIPCLLLGNLVSVALITRRQGARRGGLSLAVLLIAVGGVYSVMLADHHLNLWPSLGLDYSTHTALALVAASSLTFWRRGIILTVSLSLLAYCGLMRYQAYHTVADMLSTAAALLPVAYWQLRTLRSFKTTTH